MELASPGNHGTDLALENQRILLQTDLFQRVTQKRVPCISRSEVRVPMGGGGGHAFFFPSYARVKYQLSSTKSHLP